MSDPKVITNIPRGLANDIRQLLNRGMSSPDVVEALVAKTGVDREVATAIVRTVILEQSGPAARTQEPFKPEDLMEFVAKNPPPPLSTPGSDSDATGFIVAIRRVTIGAGILLILAAIGGLVFFAANLLVAIAMIALGLFLLFRGLSGNV